MRVEIKTVQAIINACSLLDSMESSPDEFQSSSFDSMYYFNF